MSVAINWMFNYPCLTKHGDEAKLQNFSLREILMDLGILRKSVLPKYFFLKTYSSGGMQTIHKVSAASIAKNWHP